MPAEARWAPFYANMPACDDGGVLSTISGRFAETQREFWNSQLAIAGFDRVREIGFRANGLAYIPRRYCIARAAMSDSRERTVIYNVVSDFGIIGVTWGVEWCVIGLDPNFAYAPACSTLRPIIEREIGAVQMAWRIRPQGAKLTDASRRRGVAMARFERSRSSAWRSP